MPREVLPTSPPAAGKVRVWSWSLESAEAILQAGERWLDAEEIGRADRFYFPADRRRFVAAHAGLRGLLGRSQSAAPETLRFEKAEFDKPRLAGGLAPLAFNLSHSAERAMLAVAGSGEVGVDLERHRPVEQAEAIARRHFTPAEAAALGAAGDDFQRRFFDLWTGKEAVIKLLGSGLRFPLTAFEKPEAIAATGWIALPPDNPLGIGRCWLERLEAEQGYSAAVALLEPPTEVRVSRIELGDLLG